MEATIVIRMLVFVRGHYTYPGSVGPTAYGNVLYTDSTWTVHYACVQEIRTLQGLNKMRKEAHAAWVKWVQNGPRCETKT